MVEGKLDLVHFDHADKVEICEFGVCMRCMERLLTWRKNLEAELDC